MLQSRIMQGSQETFCGLQVTALGMWKNYDKNSSFYPRSAPIKSRKLQAEVTRRAACTWIFGLVMHTCLQCPRSLLFPANSFLHPTPVMQTFPSSVAGRKYFPIPGCCKEAALSPFIFEQTNSLAQLQFLPCSMHSQLFITPLLQFTQRLRGERLSALWSIPRLDDLPKELQNLQSAFYCNSDSIHAPK